MDLITIASGAFPDVEAGLSRDHRSQYVPESPLHAAESGSARAVCGEPVDVRLAVDGYAWDCERCIARLPEGVSEG